MPITITHVASGNDNSDASSYSSPSFTPNADALLGALFVALGGNFNIATISSVDGHGGAWTQRAVHLGDTGTGQQQIQAFYTRKVGGFPVADTVDVVYSHGFADFDIVIFEIGGGDEADLFIQSKHAVLGAVGQHDVTLDAALTPDSAIVGLDRAHLQRVNAALGGYTEIYNAQNASNDRTVIVAHRVDPVNGTFSVDIADPANEEGVISAYELRAADVTAPAAPTNLSAVADADSIVLDWDDNAEPDLDHYVVKRATVMGGPYSVIADPVAVSTYDDTTAVPGVTYFYVVSAVDTSDNESADSSEASATVAAAASAAAIRRPPRTALHRVHR